jgi:hypothetical protein
MAKASEERTAYRSLISKIVTFCELTLFRRITKRSLNPDEITEANQAFEREVSYLLLSLP